MNSLQARPKRLNEQVKRNAERFPPDFVFQLTSEEKAKIHIVFNSQSPTGTPMSPSASTRHSGCATILLPANPVLLSKIHPKFKIHYPKFFFLLTSSFKLLPSSFPVPP